MAQSSSPENHSNLSSAPSTVGSGGRKAAKPAKGKKQKYYKMSIDDDMSDELKKRIRKSKSIKNFHEKRKDTITVLERESKVMKSVIKDVTVIHDYLVETIKWMCPEFTTEMILQLAEQMDPDKVGDVTGIVDGFLDDNQTLTPDITLPPYLDTEDDFLPDEFCF